MIDPASSARSDNYYLFACAPHDGGLPRRLDSDLEGQLRDSIFRAFGNPQPTLLPRKPRTTTFERNESTIRKERFSITANGAFGFVSPACALLSDGLLAFFPSEFLYDLACFLACASAFYQTADYRCEGRLNAELHIPKRASILANTTRGLRVPNTHLFNEPLDSIQTNPSVITSENFSGLTGPDIKRMCQTIMHHIARGVGRVLSRTFETDVGPLIKPVLERLA